MSERLQAIRGMNDILPVDSVRWRSLEQSLIQCALQYGYQEIRTPLVESTQLFQRTIGEVTDIVEKEMYTFSDLNGDSLTLRPEGTAGCVRACIEHGILHRHQPKLWYLGSMFRHEKPQKGRYRQFTQFGVEAIGMAGISAELELIAMSQRIFSMLGLGSVVHLQVNTLGQAEERHVYREALVNYLRNHAKQLDDDSMRRLETNPLRILDSKHAATQALLANAPKLTDYLSMESKQHFADLCHGLNLLEISYTVNPMLVRGLDYYGHTVFEWVTQHLGSQATVCAGGRYDNLIKQLGGMPTPAVGFALGVERLLLLQETCAALPEITTPRSVYFIAVGQSAIYRALYLAEKLRQHCNDWEVLVNTNDASFKSQFKKADKSHSQLALILGDNELTQGTISIKNLRETGEQVTILQSDLIQYLDTNLQ